MEWQKTAGRKEIYMETLALSDTMLKEFQEGCLAPLREAVCADDTLTMRFLGRQVEVDYRGQVLIKVWQIGDRYSIYTMPFFNRYMDPAQDENLDKILNLIPNFKQMTDGLLWETPERMRERRQRMERINNRATSMTNHSDYYLAASQYQGTQSEKGKNAPSIDVVAVRGMGDAEDKVHRLSLMLLQLCPENVEVPLEEFEFWEGDLDSLMDQYLAVTKVLDKAEAAVRLAHDPAWVAELRENIRNIFSQKCELGLIDLYVDPDTEIVMDEGIPEVGLAVFDTDPKAVGINSQFYRLAVEDGPAAFYIFHASPMGMGLYEDHLITAGEYLARRIVPKSRLRRPLRLDANDAARLQAARWFLSKVREEIEKDGSLDWMKLGRCLFRMEAFFIELQRREQAVLEALPDGSEPLEKAVVSLTEAEDALSVFEQFDTLETEGEDLDPAMQSAALDSLRAAEDAVAKALAKYELPEEAVM